MLSPLCHLPVAWLLLQLTGSRAVLTVMAPGPGELVVLQVFHGPDHTKEQLCPGEIFTRGLNLEQMTSAMLGFVTVGVEPSWQKGPDLRAGGCECCR